MVGCADGRYELAVGDEAGETLESGVVLLVEERRQALTYERREDLRAELPPES